MILTDFESHPAPPEDSAILIMQKCLSIVLKGVIESGTNLNALCHSLELVEKIQFSNPTFSTIKSILILACRALYHFFNKDKDLALNVK